MLLAAVHGPWHPQLAVVLALSQAETSQTAMTTTNTATSFAEAKPNQKARFDVRTMFGVGRTVLINLFLIDGVFYCSFE